MSATSYSALFTFVKWMVQSELIHSLCWPYKKVQPVVELAKSNKKLFFYNRGPASDK
jgi:hypothetical protein